MGEQSANNGANYCANWEWSLRSLDSAIRIIDRELDDYGYPAPLKDDRKLATDIVMMMSHQRVAVRVRRPGYEQYADEMTIRSRVAGGGRTEWDKLLDGCGDVYFYGHGDEAGNVTRWVMLDLHAFRSLLPQRLQLVPTILNRDGTEFKSIKFCHFEEAIVKRAG